MRAVVGVLLAIVMVFVLLTAWGTAADQTQDAAVTNGTNASSDAWNFTTDLSDGMGTVYAEGLVWGGIGAILLIAAGILATAGRSGR